MIVSGDVSRIGALASPGYAFNSSDSNFADDVIQGFCQSKHFGVYGRNANVFL